MKKSVKPRDGGLSRIAKVIAASGHCSRRDAEKLIAAGKVAVDGEIIASPALNVTPDQVITIDGKPLAKPKQTRLFLYYKPRGLLTTHHDPQGRPTVFGHLPKELPRVVSVGRLDLNSEGLLLLTTSGELARKMELPANALERTYRVRAFGILTEDMLAQMKKGVTVEGVNYGPMLVEIEDPAALTSRSADNHWLTVAIHEGKNREIRRVFEHFHCKVSRLIRTHYGPFALGKMARGEVKEIPASSLAALV